jgi:ribosomal protein S18 acetylase RimI-like enzyme
MRISEETEPSSDTLDVIKAGMRRHAESHVPWEEYSDLTFVARDDADAVIGAAIGEAGRGWLYVSVVWVDESFRGTGMGTRLVELLEAAAINKGCHSAYLNTFSYQARPFYEKLGYEVFGTLNDYPTGFQRFYMWKRLGRA